MSFASDPADLTPAEENYMHEQDADLTIDATAGAEKLLADLRRAGWRVGVHSDYRLDGKDMTFWLLTHESGLYVKGEASTDLGALRICALAADKIFAPSP